VAPADRARADITIEDAYHIQQRMIARRLEAGETIVGKKIGVTSKVVMNMLGVGQPDFGRCSTAWCTTKASHRPGHADPAQGRGRIAFVLKRDLMGPGVTAADVLRATDCVMPASRSSIRASGLEDQDPGHRGRQRLLRRASCWATAVDPRQLDLALRHGAGEERRASSHRRRRRRAGLAGQRRGLAGQHPGPPGHRPQGRRIDPLRLAVAMVPVKAGRQPALHVGGLGGTSVRFI
jgi:2-oxopent-4-enoate/cis-2-oxohex-4-enoate hydratase